MVIGHQTLCVVRVVFASFVAIYELVESTFGQDVEGAFLSLLLIRDHGSLGHYALCIESAIFTRPLSNGLFKSQAHFLSYILIIFFTIAVSVIDYGLGLTSQLSL